MPKKIAVNTGGGDAPGLNAVIRAVVLSAINEGWEVYGIRDGFGGLLRDSEYNGEGVVRLTAETVSGITHTGGTILGTSNRGNPMKWPQEQPDGSIIEIDRSDEIIDEFSKRGLDCLISIGGDGSLAIARRLRDKGLPVIGIPKTIDNDLGSTVMTFGFLTAVETATDAIDKLHTTAQSHKRTFVVEVMGRHAGWIALFAGIAGTADVILIPEIPFSMDKVFEKIRDRYETGPGIRRRGGGGGGKGDRAEKPASLKRRSPVRKLGMEAWPKKSPTPSRTTATWKPGPWSWATSNGAGSPTPTIDFWPSGSDAAAIELVKRGDFGSMVSLDPPDVKAVPLGEALAKIKSVPVHGDIVRTARALGISFGD